MTPDRQATLDRWVRELVAGRTESGHPCFRIEFGAETLSDEDAAYILPMAEAHGLVVSTKALGLRDSPHRQSITMITNKALAKGK